MSLNFSKNQLISPQNIHTGTIFEKSASIYAAKQSEDETTISTFIVTLIKAGENATHPTPYRLTPHIRYPRSVFSLIQGK